LRSGASRRSTHGTSGHTRLDRLRAIAAQLERLPDSRERTWMLNAVRARAVDVETDATPGALGTLAPDAPLLPERRPAQPRRARKASCAAATPEPPRPAVFAAVHTKPAALAGGHILWADDPLPGDGHDRAWTRGLRG
jgi:hypothetical protein